MILRFIFRHRYQAIRGVFKSDKNVTFDGGSKVILTKRLDHDVSNSMTVHVPVNFAVTMSHTHFRDFLFYASSTALSNLQTSSTHVALAAGPLCVTLTFVAEVFFPSPDHMAHLNTLFHK